jgi:N-acyl-D-amino-acid deacylase
METQSKSNQPFDIIIRNARIVDGTGNPWFRADIGIENGTVKKIGSLNSARSKRMIDAQDRVVCPGFIDIHNHSDSTILINPKVESMVRQGVTTQVIGNCGFSCAPVANQKREDLKKYLFEILPDIDIAWNTFGEYLHHLDQNPPSTNIASLVGHGTIRIAVLGYENRLPNRDEIEEMKQLAAGAMKDGAFGMSTGLAYAPGIFSNTDEIMVLSKVIAGFGGLYTSHIRNEANYNAWKQSVEEAVQIGGKAGIKVQLSHIESHYPNWGKQLSILKLLEDARDTGIDIACDIPPYVCGYTTITTLLPDWALSGGIVEVCKRLRDPRASEKIKEFITKNRDSHTNPSQTLIADGLSDRIWIVSSERRLELVGKSIYEISKPLGKDPLDVALELILEEEGKTPIVCELHAEEDMQQLVRHPLSIIESDGFSWAPYGTLGNTRPHPRNYGAFPLAFRKYVRGDTRNEEPKEVGKKILTLEEAVRKITSFPAQRLGLQDRGILRENMWADMVIFDPMTLEDQATYENPHQYPKGIDYVLVNGQVVVDNGEHTGAFPGKILRRPGVFVNTND